MTDDFLNDNFSFKECLNYIEIFFKLYKCIKFCVASFNYKSNNLLAINKFIKKQFIN